MIALPLQCPRCGGGTYADLDGDRTCLACGETISGPRAADSLRPKDHTPPPEPEGRRQARLPKWLAG